MNNILELKGKRFVQASKDGIRGGISMNSKMNVSSEHLLRLRSKLEQVKAFWEKESKPFDGILVSVHYNKIVAKSNRIGGLFKGRESNKAIVGAKFNKDKSKHIITYFLDSKDLSASIKLLSQTAEILSQKFSGNIDKNVMENKNSFTRSMFRNLPLSMSMFKQVIADASYIESFEIEMPTMEVKRSIVTLYDVRKNVKMLFEDLGIEILNTRILEKYKN